MDKNLWVYDLECFANFFSGAFINVDTLERKFFMVHEDVNELAEMISFIRGVSGLVGFNNVNYDYPMIHHVMTNEGKFRNKNPDVITSLLKKKSDAIIGSKFPSISDRLVIVKQLDLMRMKHFDIFSARHQSLKGLEFIMRWENLMDLPFHHTSFITKDQVETIKDYNFNDVLATLEFYNKCQADIQLRKDMSKEYEMYLMNASEASLATEIFLHFLSKDMNVPKEELREMRTKRDKIELKDCIASYIKFESKEFNAVLDYFKRKVITETKGALTDLPVAELGSLREFVADHDWEFDDKTSDWKKTKMIKKNKLSKLNVDYRDLTYYLGTGGIHASKRSGIFRSDEIYEIIDIDVTSFYPNLAIKNGFKPNHLGDTFGKRYEWLFNERAKIPKSNPLNLVYKLILNITYGKSKDINSYLLDALMTMQICISGQLSILMLIESLYANISDIDVIQANTDGITVRVKRSDRDKVNSVTKAWEDLTQLKLEYAYYDAMHIVNVNNYIAEYQWVKCTEEDYNKAEKKNDVIRKIEDGEFYTKKLKLKGLFEIDKDWHKDHSMKIVPIALRDYFTKGIPVEDTIRNHKDPFDFFKMLKATGDNVFELLVYKDGELKPEKQQKTSRYYISTNGFKMQKVMPGLDKLTHTEMHKFKVNQNQSDIFDWCDDVKEIPDRESIVDSGNCITVMNKFEKKEFNEYKIDLNYYIQECIKITKLFQHENHHRNSNPNLLELW